MIWSQAAESDELYRTSIYTIYGIEFFDKVLPQFIFRFRHEMESDTESEFGAAGAIENLQKVIDFVLQKATS